MNKAQHHDEAPDYVSEDEEEDKVEEKQTNNIKQ